MERVDIEATYEQGILKLPQELPLQDGQKIAITIHPTNGNVRKRRGLIAWKGSEEDLDHLILADDNNSLEAQ